MSQITTPYIYSHISSEMEKSVYMYTLHNWDDFLNIYFSDRESVLSKIKNKDIPKISKKDTKTTFQENDVETKYVIQKILEHSMDKVNIESFLSYVLKKFETQRKIFLTYKESNEAHKEEISCSEYIKISYILASILDNPFNLKFLNFFLKINDRIIFMKEKWIGAQDEAYCFFILSHEINLIRSLAEKIP